MPWYRSGTVSITAGQTTVTGTSTDFAMNARVGDAFQGPDGRWYEVANIASSTVLSILPAYQGPTVATGSYGLAPMQGYVKESADRLRQLVEQYGGTLALFGGAADAVTLRVNIGAATRGANTDITSLSGMTVALSVAQGGTGGKTQADARTGLGLGAVATESVLPIAKGGTGGTTAAAARAALGLGTAATANTGTAAGQVMLTGAFGLGGASRYVTTNPDSSPIGSGFNYYDDQSGGSSAANGRFGIKYSFGAGLNQGFELLNDPWTRKFYLRSSTSNAGAPWNTPAEIYTTANTTRGSGGALSAASPIIRIADVARSERKDLLEQTFEAAGDYGATNEEARGVVVERQGVGVYLVTGSLGLAIEGWRIQDPCSPDGGRMLGITESEQDEQGAVTVRLFKQRWTLDDEGEMHLGKGAPLDVPLNSWIDVRLQMPVVEAPVPPELPAQAE